MIDLRLGDCLNVMLTLPDGCVDSIITDPPYGLKFMGHEWDHGVPGVPFWSAMLRVLKPGGYLLAFGGTRTFHRQVCAIEDAGFQIRDCLMWLYGQGFPKAKSCLKPGWEPITLAWKPNRNVPPLNIDGCRIAGTWERNTETQNNIRGGRFVQGQTGGDDCGPQSSHPAGRWPANLVLTCCGEEPHVEGCPVAELDRQSGERKVPGSYVRATTKDNSVYGSGFGDARTGETLMGYGDSGGASRFFYCPKASRDDRGEGNTHPTVKSTDLMSWLVRLVTPETGTVLDPFMGSGSTGKACVRGGRSFIGIESDLAYISVAERRINAEIAKHPLLPVVASFGQ